MITVVQQQSTTDPGKVVIGFQLSQATWDRAGGVSVLQSLEVLFTYNVGTNDGKKRRLQHKRNEKRARLKVSSYR